MDQQIDLWNLILQLWGKFSQKRRHSFYLLFILIVLSSFLELVSIGAFLPFLEVILNPDNLSFSKSLSFLEDIPFLVNVDKAALITIIFSALVLISGIFRVLLLIVSTRVSYQTGSEMSGLIYKKTLYQPYIVHVNRNSSEVISGILTKSKVIIGAIIMPIITSINSILIILFVVIFLAKINPEIFILTFVVFALIYFLISYFSKVRIEILSKRIAVEQGILLKSLTEGLGGIRDVILDGTQSFYHSLFVESEKRMRDSSSRIYVYGGLPRFIIEVFAMLVMTIVAYITIKLNKGITEFLPILGIIALSAQRLLPALHTIYQSWVTIRSSKFTLKDTLELLDQEIYLPAQNNQRIPFNNSIILKDINFGYSDARNLILNDINLELTKGSRVGFVGTTGSGKSTLLDLIMGLLKPTSGIIMVDGVEIDNSNSREWQNVIAHVPQSIFLSDTTILENIAFGIELDLVDHKKIEEVSKMADIHNFIESLPEKYQTKLGERGIRFSGGQRQRIGIARALYKDAKVLVLDEATSALDNETEQKIMDSINSLSRDLTIFIIAHRLTTVEKCEIVVKLEKGRILEIINV